jgi:unsaturated rhamnogalacturonyl hydrolase
MKIRIIIFFVLAVADGFSQAATTTWAVDFADAIMSRWSSANGGVNAMTGKGWEYSNGIIYEGIQKVYEATRDTSYLNYIKKYVDSYVTSNGTISLDNLDTTLESLDKFQPGVLCLFLYKETGLVKYKTASEYIRMLIARQPANSSGGFWHKKKYPNQMWADGIFMAEPFVSQYGFMFNDTGFCDSTATFQPLLLAEKAYDSAVNLIYHAWDARDSASWADKTTGRSPAIWSRGMGWYVAGLVDILKYLPAYHYNYSSMITLLGNIAEGLKNTQDTFTGLWYEVVDKGDDAGNWLESSGSALFIYALKTAVDFGLIDKSYQVVAEKGWSGLKAKFSKDSLSRPVINDFCGAMSVQASVAAYLADTLMVDCPPSKHPHGYCGALFAASAMELSSGPKYRLNISTSGSGSVYNPTMELFHDSGSTVTITASPLGGCSFKQWNGYASGSDSIITITMDQEKSVTAVFSDGITSTGSGKKIPDDFSFCRYGNSYTVIFTLPVAAKTGVAIVRSDGRRFFEKSCGILQPGSHIIDLETDYMHSGVYFVRIYCNDCVHTSRIVVVY